MKSVAVAVSGQIHLSRRSQSRWSPARERKLTERYLALHRELQLKTPGKKPGRRTIGRLIAREQHWPMDVVCGKLNRLHDVLAQQLRIQEEGRQP